MKHVDFSAYKSTLKNAVYGEEVRGSLINEIQATQDAINATIDGVNAAVANQLIGVDKKLETDGDGADAAAVGDALLQHNAINILELYDMPDSDASGVKFAWSDGSCLISGVSTTIRTLDLVGTNYVFPRGLEAGKSYQIQYSSENVSLVFAGRVGSSNETYLSTKTDAILTIPDNAQGCRIYFSIPSGTIVDEAVCPRVMSAPPNSEILTLQDEVNTLNEGGLVLKDSVIAENVADWLDDHPEATTTVQDNSLTSIKFQTGSVTTPKIADGSITLTKFAAGVIDDTLSGEGHLADAKAVGDRFDAVEKIADGGKINDMTIDSIPFMCFSRSGYTSLQGICVINNRYLVVVRYCNTDDRSFSVWDILNQTYVSESVFSADQVGHGNNLTYAAPYIYVTTLETGKYVVKLYFDEELGTITYDSIAYTGDINIHCVAYSDGLFYCLTKSESTFILYTTEDFADLTQIASRSFHNEYLTTQGLSVHDDLVFLTISSSSNFGQGNTTSEVLPLCTELIYVTDKSLNVLKVNKYSRGAGGECEDCEVVTVDGQDYLLLGQNQNDLAVSAVRAFPLYNYTESLDIFHETKIINAKRAIQTPLILYVDNTITPTSPYESPFAKGTKGNPYYSLNVALSNANTLNAPIKLIATGEYGTCAFRYFKNPLYIAFNNCRVNALTFLDCNSVYVDCTSTTFGYVEATGGTICVRAGMSVDKLEERESAIVLYRTIFTGAVSIVGTFAYGVRSYNSIANCFITTNNASTPVVKATPSIVYVNGAAV